jgi:GNAT superfamily N-acetyltransferase
VVARYLPFADCRCDIAIAFDNSDFTGMLRMPIVSFGATKIRRESPDLECHYGPFGRAGDSIMNIRDANKLDAERCGGILYDAFNTLAEKHNFPRDFPSPEVATGLASMLIGDSGFYGVVAEEAGTIVGSNFMDERSTIFGIGPISVAPEVQNHAVGRRLMDAVLDRAAAKKAASPMPSLPDTMSGRLKSATLKGATSCAATFTASTGISSYVTRFAHARQVWSYI